MKLAKAKAIASLLEDPSSEVQKMMDFQLKHMALEELADLCSQLREVNLEVSLRIDEVRKEKTFGFYISELEGMIADDNLDMESLAIFMSRFIDHSVKVEDVKSKLSELAERCRDYLDLNYDQNQGEALAHFLGVEEGFSGNTKDYYAIGNSSIACALENKKALPITLSVLYIIIGERLGIPVKGVALPAHFVVGVFEEENATYINPFESGKIMSEDNCRALARRAGYPFTDEMLEAVNARPIFLRMLNNVKYIYSREDKEAEGKATFRLLKIWTERVFRQLT